MGALGLAGVAAALACIGGFGILFGRLDAKRGYALCSAGGFLMVVADVMADPTFMTPFWAVTGAYYAWCWWTGGGGDDTKRRLKRWGRRFQGVRRTAPQGA